MPKMKDLAVAEQEQSDLDYITGEVDDASFEDVPDTGDADPVGADPHDARSAFMAAANSAPAVMRSPSLTKEGSLVQFNNVDELSVLSVDAVVKRVRYLQEVCRHMLVENEHYGSIAKGMKPSLWQGGAQIVAAAFRLEVEYETAIEKHLDLPIGNGLHRTFTTTARVIHIPTRMHVATGVGSCSTLESKYRFRSNKELTEIPVPKSYWNNKDAKGDYNDQILVDAFLAAGLTLASDQTITRDKSPDGKWMIATRRDGAVVENTNPADFWNTCEKMSCKRSGVMGIIWAVGGSQMFTQDVEDFDPGMFA